MNGARGLLLDVGVVFFKSAWEMADDFERLCNLRPGTVEGRGPMDPDGDPLWESYGRGEITERDYWLSYSDRAVQNGAPLNGHPTFMRAIAQAPGMDPIRPEGRALVRACVDNGIRVGILTNELIDFQGRDWVEAQDWFPWFEVLVDSSELGARKPDPEPYRVAIERMELAPDEIVFIDDNPTYVTGGRDAGLRSVHLDVKDPPGAYRYAVLQLGLPWGCLRG
jgi:putative hydrolase of the HAD superfamily